MSVQSAGGSRAGFRLALSYKPRSGQVTKTAYSNCAAYPHTGRWDTKEEICEVARCTFRGWVDSNLSHGGGSVVQAATSVPSRTSARVDSSRSEAATAEIIKRCLDRVIGQVEQEAARGKMRGAELAPKTRRPTRSRFGTTARRNASESYWRRRAQHDRAAADKEAASLDWLTEHSRRLNGILARRTLYSLLPDGDYSETQMDRVQQQAMILQNYYGRLLLAVQSGEGYSVYDLAQEAAVSIGPEGLSGFNPRSHRNAAEFAGSFIRQA